MSAPVFHLRAPPLSAEQPVEEAPSEESPSLNEKPLGELPRGLMQKLKGKLSALLTACARLDRRRDGALTNAGLAKALRMTVPGLTEHDVEALLHWATADAGPSLPYAQLIGSLIAAEAASLSPSPKERKHRSAMDDAPSPAPVAAVPPSQSKALRSQIEELRRQAREGREQLRHLLHAELSAASGGDTDALCSFFFANYDDSHTGYLEEPKLREALARLFEERASRPAPPWLVEQFIRLARAPFLSEMATTARAPQSIDDDGDYAEIHSAETQAEADARARVHRLPPLLWHVMCDYRFVFEELDL